MKRIFFTIVTLLTFIYSAYSQSHTDLLKLSRYDLRGTSRSIGMGGAFGALGGDISGVAINPAGIGVYRSSEFVGTLSFQNHRTNTELNAGATEKSKFTFDLDNFGVIGVVPIDSDIASSINFGFYYNKLKTFNRKYKVSGKGYDNSLSDIMAQRANSSGSPVNADNWDGDWLGIAGLDGALIFDDNGIYKSILGTGDKINNRLDVLEKGYINSYDFTAGTTFSDIFSFGLTLSVTDIYHKLSSAYSENFPAGNNDGFDLLSYQKTEGTGFQVKTGIIIKPVDEIRIGVSYHSPTWYDMTTFSLADLHSSKVSNVVETPEHKEDYEIKTPDKWTFSLAGIIGKAAIISLDYELTNYKSNMKFRNVGYQSYFDDQNSYIKGDLRNASSIRVGAEVRFTPRVSGRVGYAWVQSPYNDNLKTFQTIDLSSIATTPHYVIDGDTHYITYGLGYRITPKFTIDAAFIMKSQKDDLFTFPKYYNQDNELEINNQHAKLKNNVFGGQITLGYRF